MEKRLDLLFKTSEGRTYRISVDNPIEFLDPLIIEAAMNEIITSNSITTKYGNLTEIKGARYVTRTVEDVEFIEPQV